MKNFLLLTALFCSFHAFSMPGSKLAMDTTPAKISILTYNIKMLPRGGDVFLHHHPLKRARLIPAKVMEAGPDVVVFQEAFDGVADRILRRGLKSMYPYNMGFKNRRIITYKRAGGVLMFSKYPLKELESITYSKLKGVDKIGHKGCLLVEVDHPVKKFQLLGTHMQAGGGKEIKLSNYKDAGDLLKRHIVQGEPQFAAGDFNTKIVDTILYPKLVNELQMENGNICTDLKCTSDHLLNDMDYYNPDKRNLIDFVFYRGNGIIPTYSSRSVIRFQQQWNKKHSDLSDHFAVLLKMDL